MGNNMLIDILKKKDRTREKIDCDIEKIYEVKKILKQDYILLHIQELTFEDNSPRKEALENVLSSLMIDGISFIYLLLGDSNGVSFYFGIVKDKNYDKELELDIDDIARDILKSSIEGNFRGSKIIELSNKTDNTKQSILNKISTMKRFARVDGVPSVNEDSEDFQGVDRLVDVMLGDEFGLLVLADPFSTDEIQEIENELYEIHDKLAPLAKTSIQESEGDSTSDAESKGSSSSDTQGENSGTSEADSKGTSIGTSRTNGESSGSSSSTSSSKTANEGTSENFTNTKTNGTSTSKTTGKSSNNTRTYTTNKGINTSKDFTDKVVTEWMQYIDEVLLKRVNYGSSKGIYHTGIYLLANEKGTLLKLANTIKSLFSGKEENKAPLKLIYLQNDSKEDNLEIECIKNLQLPTVHRSISQNMQQAQLLFSKTKNKLASWISTNELSVITGLPKKEVVGLPLKEEVEFGLNIAKENTNKNNKLLLGNLVRSGGILDIEVSIDKENLNKHTFIAGVTGSGKTTTCQRILKSADMPFMVIEPAKTEYRILTKNNKNILIFTLGDDSVAPFRINPFEFFNGENITSRVDMIKANIEAAFDMEAAIPQIIESALYKCYEKYGWNIATSKNSRYEDPFADGIYAFPTLSDLIKQSEVVVEEQGFDDRLKNDYIGSIKARLQGLLVGAKGFMLNTPRSINFSDLIEKNVILELEEIKNGAEKSLVMGFVLINLNEAIKLKYKEYKKKQQEFQHITLIEEAHRLLSKFTAGDNPSKKLGVETFADMLAEVRKYGESLIIVDQIPDKLTPEVLKNTNTKIVHRLFASDDKNAIGNTMALNDDQKDFLSNLEVGRVIISNQDFAKPLQVQIRELEDISTTTSELIDEKKIREIALKFYQKSYKRGVIQGIEVYEKEPSFEQIEEFLGTKFNALVEGWIKLTKDGDTQVFNLQQYIDKNKLQDKKEMLIMYLCNKFYPQEEKLEVQKCIRNLANGGEYNWKMRAILRIR